jgi:general secretion pathway protein A
MMFIHYHSGGVPRRINLICDRALLCAFIGETLVIDAGMARRAAREVMG